MTALVFDLVYPSGLPTHLATCPPRFALRLDLRKTRQQPALGTVAWPLKKLNTSPLLATGTACLPQRSQGGARRAGDMSGGGCAVSVADYQSSCSLIKQLKILDNSTKKRQFNGFVNCSYLNIKSQK